MSFHQRAQNWLKSHPSVVGRLLVVSLFGATLTAAQLTPGYAFQLPTQPDRGVSTLLHRVDVIGRDQRIRVPDRHRKVSESIGFLWQRGSGRACTAFCVGKSLIATNAHCLVRPGERLARNLHRFRFLLAPANGNVRRRHISTLLFTDVDQPLLSFYTGDRNQSRKTLSAMSDDWAFAKLAKPLCRGKALTFAAQPWNPSRRLRARKKAAERLIMIAYHGDKNLDHRWLSTECKLTPAQRRGLLFHTCDSFKGSSGAPILQLTDRGPEVVAINVGTYELSRFRVTRERRTSRSRRRLVRRTVQNVAIEPYQFVGGVRRFEDEDILTSLRHFREIQTSLQVRQLYGGRIDGIMGPKTRRALMRFERLEGLPAIGVPTMQLYQRLLRRDRPPQTTIPGRRTSSARGS